METTKVANSDARLQILLPAKASDLKLWLSDAITILAEGFGSELTAARLRVYVEDLADLSQSQLAIALTRARRELKFFPQIAELRELDGTKPSDENKIAAEAAWEFANAYLRKWGVDRLPLFSGGKQILAPALPPRIAYALRR